MRLALCYKENNHKYSKISSSDDDGGDYDDSFHT
jgi:hypothetical protein